MIEQLQYVGPLGIPLLLLSLAGLAIIIERVIFYIKLADVDSNPVLTNLITVMQKNANHPKAVRDELVSHLLLEVKKTYDFGIRLLRIIAVISPMLGLLGTVIGIISAFKVISLHDGPVYPALIADGLWTAMLTTAVGLIVALPCLLAAFIFARMGEKRISIYQDKLNTMSLKMEGVKID